MVIRAVVLGLASAEKLQAVKLFRTLRDQGVRLTLLSAAAGLLGCGGGTKYEPAPVYGPAPVEPVPTSTQPGPEPIDSGQPLQPVPGPDPTVPVPSVLYGPPVDPPPPEPAPTSSGPPYKAMYGPPPIDLPPEVHPAPPPTAKPMYGVLPIPVVPQK